MLPWPPSLIPSSVAPITELGMVESVSADDDGAVHVAVLLTIAGCPPLRETITKDATDA